MCFPVYNDVLLLKLCLRQMYEISNKTLSLMHIDYLIDRDFNVILIIDGLFSTV